jgi:hypothetical protein
MPRAWHAKGVPFCAVVVDDPDEAIRLVSEGRDVVLLLEGDEPPFGRLPASPGRLAVFVGSAEDPAAWEAARAMAAELFGSA